MGKKIQEIAEHSGLVTRGLGWARSSLIAGGVTVQDTLSAA